jgi:hypothetical protein
MCFLGKSKSEQFLGFLPFFSLIDIFLTFSISTLSEFSTQLFLIMYAIFNLIHNNLSKVALTLINKSFTVSNDSKVLKNSVSKKHTQNNFKNNTNINISTNYLKLLYHLTYIQNISNKLNIPNNKYFNAPHSTNYINNSLYNKIYNKILLNFIINNNAKTNFMTPITTSESNYSINLNNNSKQFNMLTNLNNLYKFTLTQKTLNRLDFNLYNNLNIAKEQRWLTKNSLLTEFLSKNSNLITQSKKLIGAASYNISASNKNLWIPTKTSSLSSNETLSYINNMNNLLYPSFFSKNFKYNSLVNQNKPAYLLNLNFFENSRF